MPGIQVFPSLAGAIKAGFQVVGTYEDGYLVRSRTERGWVMAYARCKKDTDAARNLPPTESRDQTL